MRAIASTIFAAGLLVALGHATFVRAQEEPPEPGVEQFARGRQRDRSYAPLEQIEPDELLQRTDLMAQGAGGHVQFERCLGQAQVPGGGLEGAQCGQRRHLLIHEKFSIIERK
jgi:hypothetical protein